MDVMPRDDMPSDDLQIAIKEAQATLIEAGDGMPPRDPMRFLVAGLSHFLGVLGRTTRRGEKAVSDIIAARSPLTDNDKAAITTAIEDGAYKAMKQEVRRLTRSLDLKQSKQVGMLAGGMLLVGLLIGAGGVWLLVSRPTDITGMTCGERADHSKVCWIDVAPAPQQPTTTTPARH